MKSKQFVLVLAIFPFFATYACHQSGPTLQPDRICEDVTGLNLTDQFKAGILQQKITLREIDPHTLIHKAILENAPEVVRFLLKHGVNVDYPDENGMAPLTIAILNRSNNAVEVLLTNGANVNPLVKWNGMTLLELAIFMKDRVSTKLLLRNGADVNAQTKNGKSILSMALYMAGPHGGGSLQMNERNEWANIAKSMIDSGADMNLCKGENAPLFDAIFAVVFGADISLLEFMINKGANPNMIQKYSDGSGECQTPLLYATNMGNLDLVRFLVKSGADVNKSIKYYAGVEACTPFKLALSRGHAEIVQYLLQNGART